jgi:hypothetical protein
LIISDYFFLSEEDEKASNNPMVVMVDESTGEKYARVVEHKGMASSDYCLLSRLLHSERNNQK